MAPAVQQAVEAGIPVVTIDRRVDGVEGILAHVGADNVKGGEAQAQLIVEQFPDGAKIVNLQGQPGASPAIDRNQGVHNVLDPMKDKYEFVAEQTANFAREEGASVTEAILAGLDSPPDVIVAANDDMALGALQVVQEQGLDIAIIGFDALPEALAAVRDGGLLATIEQMPGGQSRGAMKAMVEFLRERHQARAAGAADADRDHQGQPRPGRAPRRGELIRVRRRAAQPPVRHAREAASRMSTQRQLLRAGAAAPRSDRFAGALFGADLPRALVIVFTALQPNFLHPAEPDERAPAGVDLGADRHRHDLRDPDRRHRPLGRARWWR